MFGSEHIKIFKRKHSALSHTHLKANFRNSRKTRTRHTNMTLSIERRTQQMLSLLLQKVRQFPLTKAGLRTRKVCSSSSPRKARFVSQFIPWTRSFRFASSSSKLQVSQCIPRMHSSQHKHLNTHHLWSVRQLFKS